MILSFLRRNWKYYLTGVLSLITIDLAQLYVPRLIGKIVDKVEFYTSPPPFSLYMIFSDEALMISVKIFVAWIIGLALAVFLGRFVWRMMIIGSARRFEKQAMRELFDKLLELDPIFYGKMNRGELMSRFTNDLRAVWRMLSAGVVISTDAAFMSVMSIVMMGTFVNWKLTGSVIIPMLFISVVVIFFGKVIHKTFAQVQESFSKLSGFTEESISAVRIIKSFSVIDEFERMFEERAWANLRARMKLVLVSGIFWPMVRVIGSISAFLSLFLGGKMTISGEITIGDFIAFNSYLGMLVWPMTAFGWVVNIIQQGRASLKRVYQILNSEPFVKENPNSVIVEKIRYVEINDLDYRYPGDQRFILRRINMVINEGNFIGIVGTVGSGKSTLAKAILKFLPVERERIFVNGVDINDINGKSLRKRIAYVPQEGFLFSDTIYRNVTLGEDIPEKSVKEALKTAGVLDEIEKLPEGIYTKVGERGITLSGGQRQRVMIARALVRDVDLYLFDDCLSAVDPETEEEIISSLRTKMVGKTLVVITHRLKVLQDADWIYVLDGGSIIEEGTHEDLMKKGGLYREMFLHQTVGDVV